jgi:hypothetical protein
VNSSTIVASPAWRSVGFWMAAGIALLQGFYAVWAFLDPQAVAAYRGGSIEGAGEALWVHAYASRTLFISLVVALLLRRGDIAALKWVALLGVIMPASDAWSAIHSAAPASEVIRHVATAIYLFLAFAMLAHTLTKKRLL